ncbi:MAG: hypothetical protein AMXMBFR4_32010 [Candidatus Hydrogenedentota bacterium]
MNTLTRRGFFAASAASVAIGMSPRVEAAEGRPSVCAFAKHLQFITDYGELARTAKDLGLDGLDLAVRKGGHVEPASVTVDLPRAVDAIRSVGLEVPMITTALNRGDDPDARPILETASKLGIRYARIGGLQYSNDGDIRAELDAFTRQIGGLVDLLAACHIVGGYHNHSGGNNVGAPLWDLYEMIRAVDSTHFGSNLDVGHATVEGGSAGWRLNARLLAPYVKMMAVKDFVWDNGKPRWLPLGEGQVQTVEFFRLVRAAGFAGPVSLHVEYRVESDEVMLKEIRAGADRIRAYLREAGYA